MTNPKARAAAHTLDGRRSLAGQFMRDPDAEIPDRRFQVAEPLRGTPSPGKEEIRLSVLMNDPDREARPLRRRLRVVSLILGAVLLTPELLVGAPTPEAEPGNLAGQLLVATRELHDPNFDHAVIYMVRHDANGAMGLVVNDPLRDVPLATVFEQAGLDPAGVAGTIHLHAGGPVQRTRFFVLHTDDYAIADTLRVGDGLAVTSHIDILRAVVAGTGPRRTLFVVGYAGWGPGQLDAELSAGAWVHATSDEGIVFDQADQTKWHRAFARRAISL